MGPWPRPFPRGPTADSMALPRGHAAQLCPKLPLERGSPSGAKPGDSAHVVTIKPPRTGSTGFSSTFLGLCPSQVAGRAGARDRQPWAGARAGVMRAAGQGAPPLSLPQSCCSFAGTCYQTRQAHGRQADVSPLAAFWKTWAHLPGKINEERKT